MPKMKKLKMKDANGVLYELEPGVSKEYVDEKLEEQYADIANRVNVSQGVENAGKYLKVGDDGNVDTGDLPIANASASGLVKKYDANFGVIDGKAQTGNANYEGVPMIKASNVTNIANRSQSFQPIVPATLDYAVKCALCDGKGADYTDEEKASARARLGVGGDWKVIADVTITEETTLFTAQNFEYNNLKYLIKFPNPKESYKLGVTFISAHYEYNQAYYINNSRTYITDANSDIWSSSVTSKITFSKFIFGGFAKFGTNIYAWNDCQINNVYHTSSQAGTYNLINTDYSDKMLRYFIIKTSNNMPIGTVIQVWGK